MVASTPPTGEQSTVSLHYSAARSEPCTSVPSRHLGPTHHHLLRLANARTDFAVTLTDVVAAALMYACISPQPSVVTLRASVRFCGAGVGVRLRHWHSARPGEPRLVARAVCPAGHAPRERCQREPMHIGCAQPRTTIAQLWIAPLAVTGLVAVSLPCRQFRVYTHHTVDLATRRSPTRYGRCMSRK